MLDFNNAPSQQGFDLLPAGTLCKLYVTVRPGGAGQDGTLTQSKSSDSRYLDIEFSIASAPHRGRKIWQNFTLEGDGVEKAVNISAGFIRGLLNSARNIKADDDSERARSGRVISSYSDLSGMEFAARLGVNKGTGGYQDKNSVTAAIEPGNKDYDRVMAGETVVPGASGGSNGSRQATPQASTPSWASAPASAPQTAAQQQTAPTGQQPPAGNVPSWAQ